MIDMNEWSKKQYEKLFIRLNLDTDPLLPNWFKKFVKFIAFSFIPFLFSVASFIILIWILNRINVNFGFERMITLVSVIVIFTLKNMNKNIEKLIL